MWRIARALALAWLLLAGRAAADPPVLTRADAYAADAADYARQYDVSEDEALRRLVAQEASVPFTDALATRYADRLAGIVVVHSPQFAIVVHLTGTAPVADTLLIAGQEAIPVIFWTGAPATRTAILAAIRSHQADIRALVSRPPGMGVDPRTGRLLVTVAATDADADDAADLRAIVESVAGVPTELRTFNDVSRDLAVEGGGRVVGPDGTGRTDLCTTGFVVTDGARTAVTTAAHCPDALAWVPPGGGDRVPLAMVGAWGAYTQDVQIHVDPAPRAAPMPPLFFADPGKDALRPLETWRNRLSTRAGDFVCHRGERSGTSCAEVAFAEYAPPGDLCAGACPPTWVAVEGPHCHGGDSGGPVFLGTTAFGLLKGGSYTGDGTCRLYYYMSTDELPPPWRLLLAPAPSATPPAPSATPTPANAAEGP